MNWIQLTDEQQLSELKELSKNNPQVIFKHSTRCSISSMAKNRLERTSIPSDLPFYILDLIRFRPISNKIAQEFQVRHESPQVLIIVDGECIYDESHSGIDMKDILNNAKAA